MQFFLSHLCATVAQGTDTEAEPHYLIARVLSGEEAWQRYSKMLRIIMRRREEMKKEEKEKNENKECQHEVGNA